MKLIATLIISALAATCLSALAHEAPDDAQKMKAQAVRREQKPWGIAGSPGKASRTIELTMHDDMRFTPDRVEVRHGQTVRIVVKNAGRMLHEIVLGTKRELDEHASLMARFPNMEHDEPYMAHVPGGKSGEIVWTFNRPGEFGFACLIAGHYQAGMAGKIIVAAEVKRQRRQADPLPRTPLSTQAR